MELRSAVFGSHTETDRKYEKIEQEKWAKMLTIFKNKYFNIAYLRIHPQIHRGIPRFNQDPITQVMKF